MDQNTLKFIKTTTPEALQELGDIFKASPRVSILQILVRCGSANVTELCKSLKLRQPTMSHHLGILRMKGYVKQQRKGKTVVYSVA